MSQSQSALRKTRTAMMPARRRTELLSDGSYLFEDELSDTIVDAVVITGGAWLLELLELNSGEIVFEVAGEFRRPATRSFGVLYPPFSFTRPIFKNPRGRLVGIADTCNLPAEFSSSAILFETDFSQPCSAKDAIDQVRGGVNQQSVDGCPASLLSVRAKHLIDENYLAYPSIARIAARIGVSHAHLTRQFKRDFGMSPSEYLRRLRIADAPLRLARGEEIINVSLDVGYNDLSRFYKQFRKTTNTSPGVCKAVLRPGRS